MGKGAGDIEGGGTFFGKSPMGRSHIFGKFPMGGHFILAPPVGGHFFGKNLYVYTHIFFL